MLELIKLSEKIIELLKIRDQKKRSFYFEYVLLAYNDFETVHKDYLKSFKRYSEMLNDNIPIEPKHPIFGAIREDNLFSESLRFKIKRLRLSMHKQIKSNELDRFVALIYKYLTFSYTGPEDFLNGDTHDTRFTPYIRSLPTSEDELGNWTYDFEEPQSIRLGFENGFTSICTMTISEEEKLLKSKDCLSKVVLNLQSLYKEVQVAHEYLKNSLLK